MELTIEQKRAIAAAAARQRMTAAQAVRQGDAPPLSAETGMPEGMVYDPESGQVIDTKQLAEIRARDGGAGNYLRGVLGSVARGVPFIGEYIDEAVGAVGGDLKREMMRAEQDQFAADNPVASTVGGVVGGLTGMLPAARAGVAVASRAPSALGQVARGIGLGAAAGATEGAVSGFGAGRDNAASRAGTAAERGAIGGAIGGAVGGAVPAVAAGAKNVASYLKARPDAATARNLGLSPETARLLGNVMEGDGASRALDNVRRGGDGAMAADAGASAYNVLDLAIQKAGPGGRVAREAVESRAAQQGGFLNDALDDVLGKPGVSSSTDIVVYGDRTNPITLAYRRAYAQPIDYSSDAGREIERLMRENVPPEVIARANRMLRTDPDFKGVPQILADVADDGTVTFREMPTVPQIDLIKRALDDVARAGDGKGALGGNTAEGRIYGNLARRLRDNLKEAVPEYGEALDKAGTEIGKVRAKKFGYEDFLRATRDDVREEMRGMSVAEIGKIKEGLRLRIDDTLAEVQRTISDPNVDAREAMKLVKQFSSKSMREKMRLLVGEAQANKLLNNIEMATRALELRAGVAQNSKTFIRDETARVVQDMTDGGVVGRLKRGDPLDAGKTALQMATGSTPDAMRQLSERQYAEIARALTGPRGADAENMIAEILKMNMRRPIDEMAARAFGESVGAAFGSSADRTANQYLNRPRP